MKHLYLNVRRGRTLHVRSTLHYIDARELIDITYGKMPRKNTDIVRQAQNIIDSYVKTSIKVKEKPVWSCKDIILWFAAGAVSALTLLLYILHR